MMAAKGGLDEALSEQHLAVEIGGHGITFDPKRALLETPTGSRAKRRIGGLGVHFMCRLCATTHGERGGGLNRLLRVAALREDSGAR